MAAGAATTPRVQTTSVTSLAAREHADLLQRIPAVVYIAEPGANGRFRWVSPQIETILGFTPEQWCADPTLWAQRLHPDDRERVLAREEDEARGEIGLTAEEYRLIRRDGTPVWMRDEAKQVEGSDGLRLWHGVMLDITDRKVAEAELELRAAQQAAVATLGEHALEGSDPHHLMEEAARAAAELLDVEVSGMLQYLPEEDSFILRAQHGGCSRAVGHREPGGADSAPGYAMLSRGPVTIEDWDVDSRFRRADRVDSLGLRSTACVLIEGAHGTFGVLGVHSRRPRSYRPYEIDFLQSLANVLADALERQAVDDDIRHRALHDPLTGLPNRALFLDRIEQALARLRRRGGVAAVLFLDFDHFKIINDSLGHAVGDELLSAVAPRIKQAVRGSDTVARFGGDEFAILLDDLASEADAIEMAERVAALFTRPFVLRGSEQFLSASVGIAMASGAEQAFELVRDADAAMYRAKERGRARYEIFDEAMRGRALARLRLENDLRRAVEREELALVYQPVVALADGGLVAVEALVRWHHPERGSVTPEEFIPIAEETGLIEPIGRWVLEQACRQTVQWHNAFPDAPPVSISVNLSPVQLARPRLPETVRATLQATGLDPECLCLEITETAMLREPEAAGEALETLAELGVKLTLDDFGTGYSSLSLLPGLPLHAIKIDRSFVDGLGTEPHDTAITEAIIALGRALSLSVVAEGVETADQAHELVQLGCRLAQGFHFSRPLPPEDITAWLHAGRGVLSAEGLISGSHTRPR